MDERGAERRQRLRQDTFALRARWIATLLSLTFLAGLVFIWYLAATQDAEERGIGTPLLNSGDVDAYVAGHPLPAVTGPDDAVWRIPTGVLVQSLDFRNAHDVVVTGYVWQKYDSGIPDDVTRGFVLPEALEEAYEAREVDRFAENGAEVITWYVHATLRQKFDYQRYPFDRHAIWLRIWHPDLDQNVLLVPDFASYPVIDPETMPGVDSEIVYEGWIPEYAGFSYASHHYNATLGYTPGASNLGGPELYYNVGLKRSFSGPLAREVIPTAVVFLLLFVCLYLTTTDETRRQRSGFDTDAALGLCAALLFVALLAHNLIRSAVPTGQLAYLEEVIFVAYGAILLVAVDVALLGAHIGDRRLLSRDNALAKLSYWPLVTGFLLLVTALSLRPW